MNPNFSICDDVRLAARSPIASLALVGGVLLVACLTILTLGGQSKSQAYLAYVFLGGVAPLLAASLLFLAKDEHRLLAKLAPVPRFFLAFMLIGAFVLGGIEYAIENPLSTAWPFLFVVLGSALATVRVCGPRRRPRRLPHLSDPVRRIAILNALDVLLVGLLAAFAVFYSRVYPAGHRGVPVASDLVIYVWETPHFAAWLGFGLVFTGAAIWLWRVEDRMSMPRRRLAGWLALLAAGLFVLGLFDDGFYVNLPHYMPYAGPAMHSRHGGIAMVDVYSQYGLLPWLIVKVAFWLLGPTFGTAALVVRLSQIATLLTMVLVLYSVSRGRLAALALMVPALLVAITFHPSLYTLGALPSTSGLRYLVPCLMVLALVAVRSPGWSRWLGVGLLVVASLWSVETFVYTLAPWGYVLLLQAVRERSLRKAGLTLIAGLGGVVLAHAAFALAVFFATGAKIDYGPYLGQFLRYRPDAEAAGWMQRPFDQNFEIWMLVWLGIFLVLSAAGYRALQGRAPTDIASRLVPVAAYGFAALNYFMASPTWPSLGLAFLPVAIVLICGLEALSDKPRQYGAAGVAALLVLAAVSAMMVAFGSERFVRPVADYLANSSVLRHCFSPAGCGLAELPARLQRNVAAAPLEPGGPVSVYLRGTTSLFPPFPTREDADIGGRQIVEAVDILRRWTPHQPRVALLIDSVTNVLNGYVSMAVLMQTGQWYRWPISSPINDDISEPLVALILRRVAESPMQDGEIVVVANDRVHLLPIEGKILAAVMARCRLVPIETREFNSIFRTEACGAAGRRP